MKKQVIHQSGACHIKTGDTVVLLTGPKAVRGQTGTVVRVWPRRQRALVEGACAQYHIKHVKPNPQENEEGGRQRRLRPVHISNLALLDPDTGKPCRTRRERSGKQVVRVSRQSGHRFE